MNNLIDQIDAYLDGTMNTEESASFEAQMNTDAALREQVNVQRNLRAGIDRLGMKAATSATFKKITLKNKLYKWGAATVAVAAIATSAYLATNYSSSTTEGSNITYELPSTNEEGGTQWSDADRNLPTQLFTINPAKDTVIETMGGIVFAIPAGAFIDAKDPMTLEIREALTPMDIMKGGLSTTSNGELLETGGMFYINARSGETSLKINPDKPVCANVPTNEIRPGMQLFEGERTADGGINWLNPKHMEKQLIPVDIFSLDFYPPGFLDKVAELGFDANNRKVTDSIYYSYAGKKLDNPGEFDYAGMTGAQDSLKVRFLLVNYAGSIGASPKITRTNKEAEDLSSNAFTLSSSLDCDFDALVRKYSDRSLPDEGQDVWITKNSENHRDIASVILTDGTWINYHFSTERGWYVVQNLSGRKGGNESLEIDPARIAAINTAEFQNTIIATKEFEERLQVIFKLGNPNILDLYVNNLDKKLYEIDSMASAMTEGDAFHQFYLRHDGGVSVSQSHMKELQEYYQKKQEAVRIASQKTFEGRTAEQRKQDSIYLANSTSYQLNDAKQSGENFKTEYDINLKEAYRQLGITPTAKAPAPDYYSFDVQSPGWCNVDAYVYQSTTTRTTLDYTDPNSGKKAVIKYEELKINIADAASYSQLMVYLVTDSLPCFQKVLNTTGEYKENLNELFEYSLVVIGEKDGTWFSATTPKVTPGTVNVTLTGTDENSLRNTLNTSFSGKVGSDFGAEVNYMKETHSYNVRKEKEKKQEEIDRQIMEVIFPYPVSMSALPLSDVVSKVDSMANPVNKSCDEAKKKLDAAKVTAANTKITAYKLADATKTAAYLEADKIEKNYKNPLEQAAKKSAADAARKTADQKNKDAKANADKAESDAVLDAQKQADAACGGIYGQ